MRPRLVLTCLVICAAGLVAACASSSPPSAERSASRPSIQSTSRSSPAGPFRYLGPVSAATTLDGGDIRLVAPRAGAAARVSPQTAFAVCARTGQGVCNTSSTAIMTLAMVTTTAAGTAGPNGSIHPLINNALTYVIEWTGVQCTASGGPPRPSGAPSPTVTVRLCHLVDFVSADTGEYLYAFQSSD